MLSSISPKMRYIAGEKLVSQPAIFLCIQGGLSQSMKGKTVVVMVMSLLIHIAPQGGLREITHSFLTLLGFWGY